MPPRAACLFLHGFGGAPFEMMPLVSAFEARGFCVDAPTLPGHDATVEAWSRTRWSDWLAAACARYETLAAAHERVFVLGLSMGGCLSLALAERYPVAGVAVVAAPVYLYRFFPPEATDWRLPLTGLLRKFRPVWPRKPASEESRAIAPWQGYDGVVAMEPLYSFLQGMKAVRENLGRITAPLLAIHATSDRMVPFSNMREIVNRVSSTSRRGVTLDIHEQVTKHHILTTHRETRDEVARLCVEFVEGVEDAFRIILAAKEPDAS